MLITAQNSSTGVLLYYVMLGRKPRLPINIILQTKADFPWGMHSQYLVTGKR